MLVAVRRRTIGNVNTTLSGTPDPVAFPCPGCVTRLAPGTRACPACGARLDGPTAQRLWDAERRMHELDGERRELAALVARLRAQLRAESAGVRETGVSDAGAAPGGPMAPAAPVAGRTAGGPNGQQVLLGLGAFLLLSGAAFFLWVAWDLIGVVGQAIVMLTLTLTAAWSARLATVRRLPAAAETAAVIASGLLLLDLVAARSLGLAGLDRVDADLYRGVACLVGAAALLGFDALVPSGMRRVVLYRPLAAFLAALAPWSLLGLTDERAGLQTSAICLVVAVIGALVVAVAQAWDDHPAAVPGAGGLADSALVAALVAGPALVRSIGDAMGVGYAPGDALDRYAAMGLLLVPAVVGAGFLVLLRARGGQMLGLVVGDVARGAIAVGVGVLVLVALGVPLWEATQPVIVAVGAVVGVALLVLLVRPLPERYAVGPFRLTSVLEVAASVVLTLLWMMVLQLDAADAPSMLGLLDGATMRGESRWWWPVVPLAFVVAHRAVVAFRSGAAQQVALVQVGLAVMLVTGCRGQDATTWMWTSLVFAVLAAALSVVDAGRRKEREVVHALAAFGFGAVALVSAAWVGVGAFQAVLLVGAGWLVVHATRPVRMAVAQGAIALAGVAWVLELVQREVDTVEAFTLPPALGFLLVGCLIARRGEAGSSWTVVGLALAVGFVPSALVSLPGEDPLRTVLVTAVAVLVLLAGWKSRWQAPVVVGGLALVAVGLVRGGPLVEYVPTWANLVLSGAVLLAVGVGWERAVSLGQRGARWCGELW